MRRETAKLANEEQTLAAGDSAAHLMYRSLPRVREEVADLKSPDAALSLPQSNPTPESGAWDRAAHLRSRHPAQQRATGGAEYADECTKFPTTFEVQSSFADLVRLLYELERPPYHLWVEGPR